MLCHYSCLRYWKLYFIGHIISENREKFLLLHYNSWQVLVVIGPLKYWVNAIYVNVKKMLASTLHRRHSPPHNNNTKNHKPDTTTSECHNAAYRILSKTQTGILDHLGVTKICPRHIHESCIYLLFVTFHPICRKYL